MGSLIALIVIVIVAVIIGFFWCLCKIDDWARSDPAVNDIFDYGNWKRHEMGVHGYITPEQDARLKKIYRRQTGRDPR